MGTFLDDDREWLEADGSGGFASGTVNGIRTRRYHGLLLTATTPPTGRMMLVNGFEAWVVTSQGRTALSSQRYAPDVVYPDGAANLVSFAHRPWPTWTYRIPGGLQVTQELLAVRGTPEVVARWTASGATPASLEVRPLLSGRDYHALQRENGAARLHVEEAGARCAWHVYDGVPGVAVASNGRYRHAPDWYRNFLYLEEQRRGLDCIEDLASPGVLEWDLRQGPACLVVGTAAQVPAFENSPEVAAAVTAAFDVERTRRAGFADPLHQSADAYVVGRRGGATIIAGYPWFTDWGRDTFIALRGLCLATGRLDEARDILLEWSGAVSEGMLPNRFPDAGEAPEFNAVDASLWFIVAAHELRAACANRPGVLSEAEWTRLRDAIDAILDGYSKGTRYRIRCDADGLLAAGEPGVQLTWMDARVGDWVVTPRIGKPVEVQALWLNALRIAGEWSERWHAAFGRGVETFRGRFWNEERQCLFDVIDVGHVPGTVDGTIRPNQLLALGGLPYRVMNGDRARRAVATVEEHLLTPLGPRSLAPGEPGYTARCEGGVRERDSAYHQGTVWPWLMGPFVDAWLQARGNTEANRVEARTRFLEPLLAHLSAAGLGHVSEIADAEPPHTPRGCPFQAWSLGELLRLDRVTLAANTRGAGRASRTTTSSALVSGAP